jgi:hypothetical protein
MYLLLVGELGIVMSTLLSFLWTGVTMLFWRIFLKEKPSIKNIVMVIIIAGLVILGYSIG